MAAEEFQTYYMRVIAPLQEKFRKNRIEAMQYAVKITLLCLILCTALIVFLMINYPEINIIYCFVASIILLSFCWSRAFRTKQLPRVKIFNNEIFPDLVHLANSSLTCSPTLYIPSPVYKNSLLFKNPDRLSGNNLIYGRHNGVEQGFSWLHAEYRTKEKVNGKIVTTWHDIFKGIFFYADFNKNFQGTVLALPDKQSSFLGQTTGQFIQKISWNGPGKLAVMENTEFEKLFAVFATDQVEARYVLTPKIMQEFVSLAHANFIDNLSISFHRSKMFIAFHTRKSPFLYSGQDLTEDFVYAMYKKLLFFTSITDKMQLNVRIWTKK